MKRACALLLLLLLSVGLCPPAARSESAPEAEEIVEDMLLDEEGSEPLPPSDVSIAREDFIERIIALGKRLYDEADGHRKRAHYASDIYVCKNFTVYLFRQNREDFRMAEFPDTELVIPDNLPAKACKPYAYGFLWKDIPAEKGNPFYAAEQFIYDNELTQEENLALAADMMRKAQRGDFLQMSADYGYGVGAHSAIILFYDPDADEVHWMDSNMIGTRVNGIRYAYVQYDRAETPEWWASAFCHKKRGCTLYRLRDDIIYK